jgi:hypothetical protein
MLLALLLMRFEAIPSMRKLCRRLEKRRYARDICEFNGDRTPKHNTFDRSFYSSFVYWRLIWAWFVEQLLDVLKDGSPWGPTNLKESRVFP